MNCEKDDLVRVSCPDSPSYGVVTRVVRLCPAGQGFWDEREGPLWETESALQAYFGSRFAHSTLIRTFFFPDSALRPIRDPGADAVDEMVLRKPVPTMEPA